MFHAILDYLAIYVAIGLLSSIGFVVILQMIGVK